MNWKDATEWERSWWGDCRNTQGEELKQLVYARKMGMPPLHNGQNYYFDLQGKSVLDVGGGPVSMLLKAVNVSSSVVLDPCDYPEWTVGRYQAAGIQVQKIKAEDMNLTGFDEVWMYNVLQHTEDPAKIVANVRNAGKLLRVFEWINVEVSDGHLHKLTEGNLNAWFGANGNVGNVNENGAVGQYWSIACYGESL